ncbi:MAG TPA: carbamoyltransferase HypF [Opitutaceae bacterium]
MRVTPTFSDSLIRVRGTVQGVGFRPFVHRIASRLGLQGWVRNDPEGVLIRAAGDTGRIGQLIASLRNEAPPASRVAAIECAAPGRREHPAEAHFAIIESVEPGGPASAAIPADLALCPECRRELLDPTDRRHRYPFTNCTQCGPRYSLIERLPYDRPRTTMRVFHMCPDCEREYSDPTDRRFHAEPNACPSCGPQVALCNGDGNFIAFGDDAIPAAATALRAGRIGAVKGVGGFHLMCDATNEVAVAGLRRRKHREEKPLAVMFADLRSLREHAHVSAGAEALLNSPAAPVVLVPRRASSRLAMSIAPGNPWIGALLPYSPLHVLLMRDADRPLVATSANLSEEPICTDNDEALERLSGIADFHLVHNRDIARPVDDSVVRETAGGHPILLRRARGFAPAPLRLPAKLPGVLLCVGGQMKNTVAIASGDQVVVSPHIGDSGNAATEEVFERTIATLSGLYGAKPALIAHDKHPDYESTRYAQRTGLPMIGVQHHLAHVLACLLENEHPADGVLGISWDGTGYGEDGTVWGGEFILLQNQQATRFARLRPFRLPGGDAAARDARRVALSLTSGVEGFEAVATRLGFSDSDAGVLRAMLDRGLNSPFCSSGGRLFDGVSALLGLCASNAFEGQAPLVLEAAATRANPSRRALPFNVVPADSPGATLEVDWRPAVRELLSAHREPDELAAEFHRGLANAMTYVALKSGVGTVALTGGCFQNAFLHELTVTSLRRVGLKVLVHRQLSPNDNSIAAGQALGALWGLTDVRLSS